MNRLWLLIPLLVSCASSPSIVDTSTTDRLSVDVALGQTEITATGKDLQSSIESVKVITDEAKQTGIIRDTETVIQYVDKSAGQITELNKHIKDQSNRIAEQEKSRIDNRKEYADNMSVISADRDKWKGISAERLNKIIILSSALAIAGLYAIIKTYLKLKVN